MDMDWHTSLETGRHHEDHHREISRDQGRLVETKENNRDHLRPRETRKDQGRPEQHFLLRNVSLNRFPCCPKTTNLHKLAKGPISGFTILEILSTLLNQ